MTKSRNFQLGNKLTIYQSEIFHTNSGILRTADGFVLIDPAFTQADLERIATYIGPEPVLAGFSTHAHYDHLFWSSLFGDETQRYCSEGTLEAVRQHRQEIFREARAFNDDQLKLNSQLLDKHLAHLSIISTGLHYLPSILVEVVDIPGHLSGQTAFLFPKYGVLFSADTLSNTELPSIEGSRKSLLDYLESLDTLERLLERADWLVPGHGDLANRSEAKARLEMDRRYLEALRELRLEDFSVGLEALAQAFLQHIGETRAEDADSWQIHLQNIIFARQWL